MDAYEATRVVFSRIQALDPDNAAKIMGLLLIQDHGEKEMIRLAFGPESLLHSLVLKARKDLALPLSSPSPFLLSRQSSSSRLMPPSPLAVTSPSWRQPQPFSRSNSSNGVVGDELQNHHDNDLISPTNPGVGPPFYGGGGGGAGDLIDEFQLQDQLSFLNDTQSPSSMHLGGGFPDECRSPGGAGDGMTLQYGMGWPGHRRSCSVTDSCLVGDPAGFGWRPCLYFARGFCKNGSSCRFLHGLPDDVAAGTKMDGGAGNIEQQCHDALLLRSKSQRLGSSQLMASAAAFPYSPTSVSMPQSPSSKCMSFLLQQQQNDSQRAAVTAAAAAMMLGGDETHKFLTRSRSDFAGMVNPSSRQIYLTFPADSTFREEDVSNYFNIYGPVQDVRIPYQQKRMFGFVTFVYPETVKLILAKGNPHFVCDSRVLVKPYKEKGKVPDKYRNKQQTSERGDFSGCTTPTGLDHRDPFDLQLGSRMMFNSPDVLLRCKLEEQQQAADLQQAIEMQARRFMGLQLLDLRSRTLSSAPPPGPISPADFWNTTSGGGSPPDDKSQSPAPGVAAAFSRAAAGDAVNASAADKEESAAQASPNVDSDFQESALEHNLPDSPFASPTKSASAIDNSSQADNAAGHLMASSLLPPTSSLDMASFKSCLFQMPRLNSGHGAVGM